MDPPALDLLLYGCTTFILKYLRNATLTSLSCPSTVNLLRRGFFSLVFSFTHMIILLLIQYFAQRPLSRKNMPFNINYIVSVHPLWWNRDYVVDIEVHVFFLIKAFGRNIKLSFKLSYVFNIVPYGIYMYIFSFNCTTKLDDVNA